MTIFVKLLQFSQSTGATRSGLGFVSASNFRFNADGTISCSGAILSEAGELSETYAVNGNNVTVTIKKETSTILTCNLVYDTANKKLNGIYRFQVLRGFAAGYTAQEWWFLR